MTSWPPGGQASLTSMLHLLATLAFSSPRYVRRMLAACLSTIVSQSEALATIGRNFALEAGGQVTEVAAEVVAGTRSVKGLQTGAATYQPYLRTNPGVFRLAPGRSYRVTYRYKILTQGDRGFEVLFYSPTAAAAGNFLNTTQVNGAAGTLGAGTLTSRLGDYDDYQLRWNVVGRGAIAIDTIEITDVATGAVLATEDVEGTSPAIALAQSALPPAQVGRAFATTLAAVGGRSPYRWSTGTLQLPSGLRLESDGHLWGNVAAAGEHLFDLFITDATNASTRVTLRLSATAAAAPLPTAPPLEITGGIATVRPAPYAAAFRNPLGGMRPELPAAWTHPFASLGRHYIEWNLIENSAADTVEKIRAVTDRLFGELPAYNIKAIPRVYLIWPEPLARHWPADLAPDDYTSAAFRARLRRLIARLGEVWDSDPRIAYIEMGIIGHWGEHHSPSFASSGNTPALPAEIEAEFGEAFRAAFPTKKVMRRNPRDLTGYGFGVHWDVFGALDRNGFYANDTTPMTRELETPEHVDLWKTAPRGGEIAPTFLGETTFTAAAQRSVVRNHTPRLIEIIRRLHWNHLAVLEQLDRSDAEIWDKASQIQNALGYRFVVDEAVYSAVVPRGGGLALQLKVRNTGSSAFYYPWPLEVALADARTRKIAWRALWDGQDLRTWLPCETISLARTFTLPATLASGSYVVTLAILDPAGQAPAARFAVANYWMGGRTPLGPVAVDTIAPTMQLNEFDDLQTDNSLYYLPATEATTAPAIVLAPAARTAGTGQSVTFSVAAAGSSISYQWLRNGMAIAGATGASLTLASVSLADAGDYAVTVSNAAGTVTSAAARLGVTSSRLANLSVLSGIDRAGESLTLGYVVGGAGTSGSKPLLVRAVGPSLEPFGVAGVLDDPRLEVFTRGREVAANDNWGGAVALATAMAEVGAFAFAGSNSRDAAAAVSVVGGDGTVKVSATGAGTGTVLAEIYDATPSANMTGSTPRLINLSVLKPLGGGFSLGFVVEGSVARNVLIRAIGPTLRADFGIADAANGARIALLRGQTALASNDRWGGTTVLRTAFTTAGAFALPSDSRDAALIATLAPGDYTATVSGIGGDRGTILVEIYELP